MTMRLANYSLIAAAMILSAHTVSAETSEVMTWKVDGETRRAIVYAPRANSAGGKAPLVLSFHGHGDNIQNFQYTNLHRAWPEAIVVYFQGLPSRRDGLPGWQVEKGQDNDRDLRLVDAALASLRDKGVLVGGSRLPRRARRTVDRRGTRVRARSADPAPSIVSRRRGACRRR